MNEYTEVFIEGKKYWILTDKQFQALVPLRELVEKVENKAWKEVEGLDPDSQEYCDAYGKAQLTSEIFQDIANLFGGEK